MIPESLPNVVVEATKPVAEFLGARTSKVCKCHSVEINKTEGRAWCSITTLSLARDEIIVNPSIGSKVLRQCQTPSTSLKSVEPTTKYKALSILNTRTLDESLFFGSVIILNPTRNDSLDLDFLENNQNIFFAILRILTERVSGESSIFFILLSLPPFLTKCFQDAALLLRHKKSKSVSGSLYQYFIFLPGSMNSGMMRVSPRGRESFRI
jgi:hypothetical protein